MSDTALNALTAKRVGQYLIDAGVLKREQLEEALDRQKRMSRAGFHVLLGTILEEMGAIDRQSLEAIILRQRLDEGSVNLGDEADWSAFRSTPEPASTASNGDGQNETGQAQQAQQPHETPPAADTERSDQFDLSAAGQPAQSAVESSTSTGVENVIVPEATKEPEHILAGTEAAKNASTLPADRPEDSDHSDLGAGVKPEPEQARLGDTNSANEAQEVDSLRGAPVLSPQAATKPASDFGPSATTAADSEGVGAHETETREGVVPSPETWSRLSQPTAETQDQTLSPDAPAAGSVEMFGFTFRRSSLGLAEAQVSAVMSQLLKRSATLEEQMVEAKENLSHLDSMRRYGEQTIKAADTIANQIHEEAEKQAAAIRDRAQQEARRIVADAKAHHDEIVHRAGEKTKRMADEVAKNIEDHHQLNDRLLETAERMMKSDAESDEA